MSVNCAILQPVFSRLVAGLTDTLTGSIRVDIAADLAGGV